MSTHNQVDVEAQKDPDTLEREIDQQRAEIGNIVEELESKFSPGQLIDTALGYAKGNGGEFLHNLGDTLKANPVPTVLTSIGLVWLMAGQNRRPDYGTGDSASGPSVGDRLSAKTDGLKSRGAEMRNRAGQMRQDLSSSLGNARARVSETGRNAGDSLKHTAGRARGGFNQLLNEQPLALGAMGIALGALLAADVPPTRREDELIGSRSDQMTDRLKRKAEEGYQQASAKGEEAMHHLKEESAHSERPSASGPH